MSSGVIFILGKGVSPILAYGVKPTWPQGSSAPGFSRTAIDRTDMYRGFGSLFAKHLPKVPETYRKWKSMRIEVEEKETRNVRQEQPKPKLDITPLLGGEKKAVIDRETGGLKL